MKFCPRCKQVKPISEFHKAKDRKDGHNTYCKICRNEITNERRGNPEVRRRYNEHTNEYRKKPEIRMRAKEWKRKNYQQKPDLRKKRIEYAKEYGQTPKAKQAKREYNQRYLQNRDNYDKHQARTIVGASHQIR